MRRGSFLFYILLLGVLVAALYFAKNADTVYALVGNYYYRCNDIPKAQKFYEKSFAKGHKNSSTREIYINSIINSPLTIQAQEKLVSFAEDNIQDAASVKAKYFLYDLKREIHKLYPDNYIKQAPYNQQIVRWNKFPIKYTYKNKQGVPESYISEINTAFSEWEKAGVVLFAESDENPNIIIDFKNNTTKKLDFGRKYVIAYTVPLANGNKLESMNINFHIQDPEGKYFSNNQIYNTALHEIFHALGFMGHSYESGSVMYLAKDNKTLQNDLRLKLTDADVNTLKLLYKIKPDITNEGDLPCEYVPYLLLGDDEELNYSKSKEAKNYIYHAPSLPSGYIDLAESLVADKKYSDAIKTLEKALSLADTKEMQYIVYYNLAVSYYYINHTEMALGYLGRAMELKDSEELHLLRAEIYLPKDIEAATKEYEKLIQISPSNIDYATRLANIYIKEKKFLKARRVLKIFIKQNPQMKNSEKLSRYKFLGIW